MSANQNESKLISIFVQGTLYGAFFIMFILTYWTLVLRRAPGRPLNKPMLTVSITMFVLATIHIVINLIRILQAFVGQRDRSTSYWNQLSEPTNLFGSGIYFIQTLVGDGVALYRCWVVWGRRREYIAMPALFYLGSFVTGIGTLVSFHKLTDASLFALRVWLVSFFSFTLATSTICTIMIATRIWFLSCKSFGDQPGGHLYPIMRIVLESGAIYSGALVALLVLFETRSWFIYVLVDSITPIIGLVFSIIIVRVGLGITTDGPSPPTDSFDTHRLDTTDTVTYHRSISNTSRRFSRFSRDSSVLSPSHFWPSLPDRPRNSSSTQRQSGSIKSMFSFKRDPPRKERGHYNVRSQITNRSSLFRSSTEIEVDLELDSEIDEARYKHPKAPPFALLLPRSDRIFTQ